MFADTLTLFSGVTAVKINQDKYSSEYRFRDTYQEITLKIRHSSFTPKAGVKTDRHAIEMVRNVFATATAAAEVHKAYAVMELPYNGNLAYSSEICEALGDFIKNDTLQPKIFNWES